MRYYGLARARFSCCRYRVFEKLDKEMIMKTVFSTNRVVYTTSICLSEETEEWLTRLANMNGLSRSAIVRNLITGAWKKYLVSIGREEDNGNSD